MSPPRTRRNIGPGCWICREYQKKPGLEGGRLSSLGNGPEINPVENGEEYRRFVRRMRVSAVNPGRLIAGTQHAVIYRAAVSLEAG
jgi:hypothetical protein